MRSDLEKLTFSLCSLMSISGNESKCLEELNALIGGYFDEHKTDAVGNHLFIKKAAKENAPTLLIDTHFDEIGMMVTDILDGGFVRVTSVGGLDPAIMQASSVLIYGEKTVRGIICSTPPHLKKGDDKKLTPIDELLIDTGYEKDELEKIVRPGTPVGFLPIYNKLGYRTEEARNNATKIVGKSFDNKACAAAAILGIANVPREKMEANVCLLLSCHEETVRIGGVAPAAFALEPDYAVVIDVNLARVPGADKCETVEMGKGISISMSAITDKLFTDLAIKLCLEKEISFSKCAAPSSTGTNTTCLSIVGHGIPVIDVGLPLKNMHTATEVIDLADSNTLADFVSEIIACKEIAEVYKNA